MLAYTVAALHATFLCILLKNVYCSTCTFLKVMASVASDKQIATIAMLQ